MNEILQKLEEQIARLHPHLYRALREGLTDEQIDALEVQHNIKLPDDLRTLYKWRNGQVEWLDNMRPGGFANGFDFQPLEAALGQATELIRDFEEMEVDWWDEKWIPFLIGEGDYICCDAGTFDAGGAFEGRQGQILTFWHDSPFRQVLAPSLAAFLGKLSEFYETAPALPDGGNYHDGEGKHVWIECTEGGYPIAYTVRDVYR